MSITGSLPAQTILGLEEHAELEALLVELAKVLGVNRLKVEDPSWGAWMFSYTRGG